VHKGTPDKTSKEEELKKRRRDDEYREEQARIRVEKMMQERELQNRIYKRQRIEAEMYDWSSNNY
jgi:7-keto-8-aminopelargonate synthetase-like enzyme